MKKQKKEIKSESLFSGENSQDMWDAINKARTKKQLRRALGQVCCNLQKFERRVEHGST